jgi:hypothetical protein
VHIVSYLFVVKSLKYRSKVAEENFEIKPVAEVKSLSKNLSGSLFGSYTQGFDSIKTSKFKIEGAGFSFTQTKSYIKPFDEDVTNSNSGQKLENSLPLF